MNRHFIGGRQSWQSFEPESSLAGRRKARPVAAGVRGRRRVAGCDARPQRASVGPGCRIGQACRNPVRFRSVSERVANFNKTARFVLGSFPVRFLCTLMFSTTSPLRFRFVLGSFPVRFWPFLFVFSNFSGSFLKNGDFFVPLRPLKNEPLIFQQVSQGLRVWSDCIPFHLPCRPPGASSGASVIEASTIA